MVNLFRIYDTYPFSIPLRVRFFNIVRNFFTIPALERIVVGKLSTGNIWWRKLIPPVYLYGHRSMRKAKRNGIKYHLDLSKLIDHSIFFYTLNEPGWHNLYKVLHRDSVVIDIGANIGYLSLNFALICDRGHVFSFEPDSKNFESLQENIHLNDFKNVTVTKVALGADAERKLLYKIYDNNPGANRILTDAPEKKYESEWVEIKMLDELIKTFPPMKIDLVKIDVEGYELFVLQGAEKVIKQWRPILFVELAEVNLKAQGYSGKSLIEYIEQLNYEVLEAKTMKEIDKSEQNYHTDILCFPL